MSFLLFEFLLNLTSIWDLAEAMCCLMV